MIANKMHISPITDSDRIHLAIKYAFDSGVSNEMVVYHAKELAERAYGGESFSKVQFVDELTEAALKVRKQNPNLRDPRDLAEHILKNWDDLASQAPLRPVALAQSHQPDFYDAYFTYFDKAFRDSPFQPERSA